MDVLIKQNESKRPFSEFKAGDVLLDDNARAVMKIVEVQLWLITGDVSIPKNVVDLETGELFLYAKDFPCRKLNGKFTGVVERWT